MNGIRMDRGYYTQPTWLGLLCSGLYVLVTNETIHRISEGFGNVLGGLIAIAALTCLVGSCLHDWRVAFRMELYGLSIIVVVMGILAVVTDLSLVAQTTFVGGLGVWVQLGSIRLAYALWTALRHDRAG